MPKGLGAQVETAQVVPLAGQQALFRLDEAERVVEMLFGDFAVATVVDEEPVPLFDSINRVVGVGLILDAVTGLEMNPDERGG